MPGGPLIFEVAGRTTAAIIKPPRSQLRALHTTSDLRDIVVELQAESLPDCILREVRFIEGLQTVRPFCC